MTRTAVCRLATQDLQLAARSRPSLPVGGRFPSEKPRIIIINRGLMRRASANISQPTRAAH